jgi:hypothetical protein
MRLRVWTVTGVGVLLACAALLAQNAMNLQVRTDSNGYLYVTGTGAGTGQGPLTPFGNLGLATDSNGYLKVNCASGCGGTVGGANKDVQCNVSSALNACETGVLTYDSSTHVLSSTIVKATSYFQDGTNYRIKWDSGNSGVAFRNNADNAGVVAVASDFYTSNLRSSGGCEFRGESNRFWGWYADSNCWPATNQVGRFGSAAIVGWNSAATTGSGAIDVGFARNAAGVVEVDTGTASTYADLKLQMLRVGQTTAPTCSASCGTSPSVTGSDTAMLVTMGASGSPASPFTVTFNHTWAAAPSCMAIAAKTGMVAGKAPILAVPSTTTVIVTTNGTAPATSDQYAIHCIGVQ